MGGLRCPNMKHTKSPPTKMTTTRSPELRIEQAAKSSRRRLPQPTKPRSSSVTLLHLLMALILAPSFFVAQSKSFRSVMHPPEPTAAALASFAGALPTGSPPAPSAERLPQPPLPVHRNKVKSSSVGITADCSCFTVSQDSLVVTEDFYEYEENCEFASIKVAGRLAKHINFWYAISAPSFILNSLKFGYVLPFIDQPQRMFSPNNKSALTHSSFVDKAITELVQLGSVETCIKEPIVVNPLTVSVQSNGKKRLILDLRLVNEHLERVSVKYEDMRTALIFLKKGGFMFKFDIKSGYHHIDICTAHRDFLGFAWPVYGSLSFFRFRQLPFGLSSAPFLFTKVVRPLVKKWRSEGKSIVVFLDDGLGFAASYEEALRMSTEVKADILASGFVPNAQKSMWTPVSKIEWLGYEIDLASGFFAVPDRRTLAIKSAIDNLPFAGPGVKLVRARVLASVVGKIMSTGLVVGNVSKLMTKALHCCIESKTSWNSSVALSRDAMDELEFWSINIDKLNKCPIGPRADCSRLVFVDASSTGFGGYIVDMGDTVAQGLWDNSESRKSSTWRELKAVDLVLKSLAPKLSCRRTKWFTDNQAVAKIAESGSMKSELQSIALSISQTCLEHNIQLNMEWVPRSKNEKADKLSRIVDNDDWSVAGEVFHFFDRCWGTHSIDRFASYYNAKTVRFNSRYWNPGCEAIDAFTLDWSKDNNWLVPPISVIARVLLHMADTKAVGTLIRPCWYSAPYWPLLFPDGHNPIRAVVAIYEIPAYPGLFIPGRGGNVDFVHNICRSKILAIRLNYGVG